MITFTKLLLTGVIGTSKFSEGCLFSSIFLYPKMKINCTIKNKKKNKNWNHPEEIQVRTLKVKSKKNKITAPTIYLPTINILFPHWLILQTAPSSAADTGHSSVKPHISTWANTPILTRHPRLLSRLTRNPHVCHHVSAAAPQPPPSRPACRPCQPPRI